MRRVLILLLLAVLMTGLYSYPKLSIVERFTNAGCVPCANINNSWYNATTASLLNSKSITHLVYNVEWPSAYDPMYLLNSTDNNKRRGVYGVNSVPWIVVNGTTIGTSQSALENAVNTGNAQYSPFFIELIADRFANDVLNVKVKIKRDPSDNTTFTMTRLFLAITERTIQFSTPPGPNGELKFFNISRKMLPDGKGVEFAIPAPGDSVEMEFSYIPTAGFRSSVIFDSLRVVAFIQRTDTKEIYQSAHADFGLSAQLNAAFQADRTLGAIPFTVSFTDYSTGSGGNPVTSWSWDFNNDGTIDATIQNPTFTFTDEGEYSVKLIVGDGITQRTRILSGYINALKAHSDILVVNGIEFVTYPADMANFYNSSAGFGSHEVDVWDLFGLQGYDYSTNTQIQKKFFFDRKIPLDVLKMYPRVIWFGNNYGGDFAFWDASTVMQYINSGGNFLLATRQGGDYLSAEIKSYCGITSVTGLVDITTPLISKHDSLVSMAPTTGNTRAQMVYLDASSNAITIFDDNETTTYVAGIVCKKDTMGTFVYIAGRPYRFNTTASAANYNFIINHWLKYDPIPTTVSGENLKERGFELHQNFPNPFNPTTTIQYTLAKESFVRVTVYNTLGENIATLFEGTLSQGSHKLEWNANVPSGIYFCRLEALPFAGSDGKITLINKMVLAR